jgi:hypothetical protein
MKDHRTTPGGEPANAGVRSGPHPRHRLHVADDVTSILQLNTGVLIRSGYGVDSTMDGADAWRGKATMKDSLMKATRERNTIIGAKTLGRLTARGLEPQQAAGAPGRL